MCGIFALLNTDNFDYTQKKIISEQFNKGKRRGPEYSKLEDHYIPYFWMPKYTNAYDPSARTLDVYTK